MQKPVSAPKTFPSERCLTNTANGAAIFITIQPCSDPAGDIMINSPRTNSHRPISPAAKCLGRSNILDSSHGYSSHPHSSYKADTQAVIVLDTSILSLAFRRRRRETDEEPLPLAALRKLIADDAPLAVPGIVLQELLSGVAGDSFANSRRNGRFPLLLAGETFHVRAAQISNACRHHGVACSTIER